MIAAAKVPFEGLYEQDETAWLEAMAELCAAGRTADLDLQHLQEYLSDMARRDRREVVSRLVVLLTHLLKWDFQPDRRASGWDITISTQRRELAQLFESTVLRNHAEAELPKAYSWAVHDAALETGLPESTFPANCPYSLDTLMGDE